MKNIRYIFVISQPLQRSTSLLIDSEWQGSPPLSMNAPPIAGVVSWSRQLLRRVEEPMEVFRRDPDVMESLVSQLNIIFIQNSD